MGCNHIEPESKRILALFLANKSKERNMFVAERFIGGLVKFMGNIRFQRMVVHGTQWLIGSLDSNITTIPLTRKAISKERCNISRRRPQKDWKITFPQEKMIVSKAMLGND